MNTKSEKELINKCKQFVKDIDLKKDSKKIKTYVLTVSKTFPKTHIKSGESTGFVNKISNLFTPEGTKIHTIRANYELWEKRAKEINEGNAVLSIRCWWDKPYKSRQFEICRLERIGVQKLTFQNMIFFNKIDGKENLISEISKNDGLDVPDFIEWFKNYDLSKPMAIIHFTDFRY